MIVLINTQRGRLQCEAIRQSYLPERTPHPTTHTPPDIHLPTVSPSQKSRSPRLVPLPSPLASGFVNNQLCDYSNEVINYRPSPAPSVPRVGVLITTR